jgi:DNA-binding LacI/PurR family transcriptional regulator
VITLKDIALAAGVDKSTVSRALNDQGNISTEKRRQICELAASMGYVPNESAKILAGKSARTVGVILPEIDCNYYSGVVGALETKLREKGYSILIGQSGFDFDNEIHFLKLFAQKKVDGIIFDLYNKKKFEESYDDIKRFLKIPLVIIETGIELSSHDVIEIDQRHGIKLAIEHLFSSGAKSIGFISEYLSSSDKLPLFRKIMIEHGLKAEDRYIKIGDQRLEEGGYLRMSELITQGDLPDAVFVSYDTMAQGCLNALYENGIRVPDDIMIVGFENIRESLYFNPPLTTISPPLLLMAQMAVERILKVGGKPEHTVLKPEIVIRRSTKK